MSYADSYTGKCPAKSRVIVNADAELEVLSDFVW